MTDLLFYWHYGHHPSDVIAPAKTSLFLFLMTSLSLFLTFLSLEGVARLVHTSPRRRSPLCHVMYCVTAVMAAAVMVGVFVVRCVSAPDPAHSTYVVQVGDR